MGRMPVLCPHCHSDQGIQGGKTKAGQPRYKGQNTDCPRESFPRDLVSTGRAPAINAPIADMRRNGSGIRDPARGVKRSPTTVMNALKKRACTHLGAPPTPPPVTS
jgi:transposase-like protein